MPPKEFWISTDIFSIPPIFYANIWEYPAFTFWGACIIRILGSRKLEQRTEGTGGEDLRLGSMRSFVICAQVFFEKQDREGGKDGKALSGKDHGD